MKKLFGLVFFLPLLGSGCEGTESRQPATANVQTVSVVSKEIPEPSLVSIIALLANPTQFDGKRIQVMGFMHLEFEDMAVYLGQEDFQNQLVANGIWLNLSKDDLEKFKASSNRYVIVQGTFRVSAKDSLYGQYNSAIDEITMIKPWADIGTKRKPSL